MCVLILSTALSKTFIIRTKIEQRIINVLIDLQVSYPLFCQILMKTEIY